VSAKYEQSRTGGSRFSAGVESVLHARGQDLACRAHDLSRSGARLTGDLPSLADESVEVTFRLPVGDFSLTLPGRVIRTLAAAEDDVVSLGLRFENLCAEDRENLEILVARVVEGGHPAPIEMLKRNASATDIRQALEQVPIAHRVVLALRANPHEREILRHDTRPPVLEALARNPQMPVVEARELASSRHVTGATLELLARNTRWGRDEQLRVCIVTNQRVPLPLAKSIVEDMRPETLRKVVQKPGLHPSVRDQLMRLMVRGTR
jgi:hypothetical protein